MDDGWNNSLKELQQYIGRLSHIPVLQWPPFFAKVRIAKVKKGHHLWGVGSTYDSLGITLKGIGYVYFQREDGTRKVRRFISNGNPAGSLLSVINKKPSQDAFLALSDMYFAQIKYEELIQLGTRHVCWERLLRRAYEDEIRERETREMELFVDTPTAIYERVFTRFPFIEGLVPQYLIASYVGITPEALSRIRSQRVNSQTKRHQQKEVSLFQGRNSNSAKN